MPVGDPRELTGLLLSYIDGDVVARKIVLDWLEEHEYPRREAVAAEAINASMNRSRKASSPVAAASVRNAAAVLRGCCRKGSWTCRSSRRSRRS